MTANRQAKDLILAGSACTVGLILPGITHALAAGPVLLPMHLPVLACALLVEWPLALQVGLLTPLLSALLTGMPPLFPTAPLMSVEFALAATVASMARHKLGLAPLWSVLLAITGGMAGHLAGTLLLLALAPLMGLTLPTGLTITAKVITALPGYAVQITTLPLLLAALEGRIRRGGASHVEV